VNLEDQINILIESKLWKNLIIANGDQSLISNKTSLREYILEKISKAKNLLFCDGAINHFPIGNISGKLNIIGDLDSIDAEIKQKFPNQIINKPSQDFNDLTKAIDYFLENNVKKILILGATGGRDDHNLANLSILLKFSKDAELFFLTPFGIFSAHNLYVELTTIPGQQISIFTANQSVIFNSNDLKWPLKNHQFSFWADGSLNQAISNRLEIDANGDFLVFRSFEIKNNV